MNQTKINQAVQLGVIALQSVVPHVSSDAIQSYGDALRNVLKYDGSEVSGKIRDAGVAFLNEVITSMSAIQKTQFFCALLTMEERLEKETPGRFSVEHRIDLKVAKKDQDAFWGQSFANMLARLSITKEAFLERLEEDLASQYHDNFSRTINYSEIAKVFMDQHMSYEHYLYCAKLLGFTHVKIELI